MKLLNIAAAFAAVCLASACSGGGGGSGDPAGMGTLTDGSYTSMNGKIISDGCHTGAAAADLNGQTYTITLTGSGSSVTAVDVNGISLTGSGFTFTHETATDTDLTTQGGPDCTIHEVIDDKLIIIGTDKFYVREDVHASKVSGTQCDAASLGTSLPCAGSISFEASK